MSMLTRGQVDLLIWPEIEYTDDRGNPGQRKPADKPVKVRARVRPVSSEESNVGGQSVTTLYRVTTRDAPAGPWARLRYACADWDVVGDSLRHTGSERTRRVVFLIRARTSG